MPFHTHSCDPPVVRWRYPRKRMPGRSLSSRPGMCPDRRANSNRGTKEICCVAAPPSDQRPSGRYGTRIWIDRLVDCGCNHRGRYNSGYKYRQHLQRDLDPALAPRRRRRLTAGAHRRSSAAGRRRSRVQTSTGAPAARRERTPRRPSALVPPPFPTRQPSGISSPCRRARVPAAARREMRRA